MSLTKKYSFHDTFVKTCEFKNGQGDCKKTRESKKCIDDNCEIIHIPMKKKEILDSYYQNYNSQNYSQEGSGNDTFKCPYCDLVLPTKDILKHIKLHTNTFGTFKPTNLFPQYGGCDTCMVGGNSMIGAGTKSIMKGAGVHENKYICPMCHEHYIINDMKDHYINFHR